MSSSSLTPSLSTNSLNIISNDINFITSDLSVPNQFDLLIDTRETNDSNRNVLDNNNNNLLSDNKIECTAGNNNNQTNNTINNNNNNNNKRVIKTFLKFIKPSVNNNVNNANNRSNTNNSMNSNSTNNKKKQKNSLIMTNSLSINNLNYTNNISNNSNSKDKQSSSSIKRSSKLRPSKSIGVLNNLNQEISISSDDSYETKPKYNSYLKNLYRNNSVNFSKKEKEQSNKKVDLSPLFFSKSKTRNKNNKERSFSLMHRPGVLSASSSISSSNSFSNKRRSLIENQNNSFRSSTNREICSSSKDLSWYKLEELEQYYKILEHVMEETSANIFNVIELIQEKFIILTGGCTKNGSLLFTFTDNCNNKEIKVENYRKAIDYFCNIPSESDKQTGFSILIDRRNDKWSSVKNVLILIQDYFPAKLNTIFILRPQSYFQRVLSSLLFQEDSLNESVNFNFNNFNQSNKNLQNQPFNIKICKTVEELYESIDKQNLTSEFGGTIHYRHQEWIEQRQFIEKLSSNVNECVYNLKQFIKSMEETDFPNDVTSTELLINSQLKERADLLSTVHCTRRFGETVLDLIEKTSKIDMFQNKTEKYSALTPDIRIHYQTVFNLLKLMEESQRTLEMFWNNHFIRLNKCLDLRKFEQKFKDVRINLLKIYEKLNQLSDDNIEQVQEYDNIICLIQALNEQSKSAFEEAFNLYNQGIQLLISNKTSNSNLKSDDSYTEDKLNIDSGVESCSNEYIKIDLLNNNSNLETSEEETMKMNKTEPKHLIIDIDNNNNTNDSNKSTSANTNTGYCVDSVEPKCSELKRLIDEFKLNYLSKLTIFKNNKILVQKLNQAKEYYAKGIHLFNEQELINMNQEKARKYLTEIDQWIKNSDIIDLNINNNYLLNDCDSQKSELDNATISSFEIENQSINSNINKDNLNLINSIKDELISTDEFLISSTNSHKNKQTNLIKNFELISSQIKSLNQMFDKRKEQLKKSAYPTVTKPVQRVEPQQVQSNQINDQSNKQNDIQENQLENNNKSSNSSLIKRDSMTKAYDKGNLYEISKAKRTQSINNNNNNINSTVNKSSASINNLKKSFKKNQKKRKSSNGSSSSSLNENEEDELEEEQKKLNEKKIKHILNELMDTERVYVNELKLIIDGYLMKLCDSQYYSQIPSILINNKDLLFGNIREIFQFHNKIFLKELELCQESIPKICKLFIECKQNFYLYSTYCLNKPHSEEIWRDYCISCQFFKTIQLNLGQKLPLDSYLLKPVQRISKYQLLLRELKKSCSTEDKQCVDEALQSMLDVVNNLNDVMHASFIIGFNSDIKSNGRLLKRDQLQMTKLKRNLNNKTSSAMNVVNRFQMNSKCVEIFLFEKAILICKKKSDDPSSHSGSNLITPIQQSQQSQSSVQLSLINNNNNNTNFSISSSSISNNNNNNNNNLSSNSSSLLSSSSASSNFSTSSLPTNSLYNFQYIYQFKELIKTNEIGLTENLKNDKKKFEIWSDTFSYIFEASNEQEKLAWINQIKCLLESQLNEIKSKYQSIKLESLNKVMPTNIAKTQSFKYHSSPLSTTSSYRSSSISSSSNRTNSFDYDYDPDADADADFSSEFSNSVLNSKVSTIDKNKIVNVHNHTLLSNKANKFKISRRISNDLSGKTSPSTSLASLSFSTKIKSNSLLSIDHDKIMSF